ncbi:unnamed protein product [Durusdinium trenchii]|uniref:Uncharacterized protein n=1 Tax=Durusdinium trenchii TaxID=1381693 RepID=A0ABP0NMV3_9DINO
MTLCLVPVATDISFYGTARKELTIFGCCLVEHAAASTAAAPMLQKTFLIFVSDILDHTACRSVTLLDKAIASRSSTRELEGIDLISDCAGHFRSYETMHWALARQLKERQIDVAWHLGVETHLKHDCDRLFGWWRQGLRCVLLNQMSIIERWLNCSASCSDTLMPLGSVTRHLPVSKFWWTIQCQRKFSNLSARQISESAELIVFRPGLTNTVPGVYQFSTTSIPVAPHERECMWFQLLRLRGQKLGAEVIMAKVPSNGVLILNPCKLDRTATCQSAWMLKVFICQITGLEFTADTISKRPWHQ